VLRISCCKSYIPGQLLQHHVFVEGLFEVVLERGGEEERRRGAEKERRREGEKESEAEQEVKRQSDWER
jgi:hypothetical protein